MGYRQHGSPTAWSSIGVERSLSGGAEAGGGVAAALMLTFICWYHRKGLLPLDTPAAYA